MTSNISAVPPHLLAGTPEHLGLCGQLTAVGGKNSRGILQAIRPALLLQIVLACALAVCLLSPVRAENVQVTDGRDAITIVHSPKKGAGITPIRHKDWQQRLNGLNVSWFYTWRTVPPVADTGTIEFVPMVWGNKTLNEVMLTDLKRGRLDGRYKHLLGFNEPDAKLQSNISVNVATNLWHSLVLTGLRMGSPATVNANNLWMQEFMSRIETEGVRVDFIAVHWYGGPSPEKFLKYLEYVHSRYARPIWITEFAVADWDAGKRGSSRYTRVQTLNFMKAVIPALEQIDYIERYAWFSAEPDHPALGQSALFDGEGDLTQLGQAYAGY